MLTVGTRLGPYEILGPLGQGGMGEVYQARDSRLNRTVAIKVLPEYISRNPEARQRFEREAQAIAGLNHPNICVLHDVGEHDDINFLVMEHLEGVSLEERLKTGPVPLAAAVKIGLEIADALDKAHRGGVVHRDLKPANVMLTKGGAKLLDFGLAKIGSGAFTAPAASMMPTTAGTLTAAGTLLGTIPYMAPEQIEGRDADARTDIFAFGAMLYEMVTGRRAFQGKSQPSVMSAILSFEPPPPSQILPAVSPLLDHIIERCLAKDPDDRWHSARDLWLELKSASESLGHPQSAAVTARPTRRTWVAAAIGVALLAVAVVAAVVYWRAPAPLARSLRFEIAAAGTPQFMAVSPDGRTLAYAAPASGTATPVLWVRPLNSLDARVLAGTEGADMPDWSPDGRYIVFGAAGKLKRVDVSGGPPQTLTNLLPPAHRRSTWSNNDVIVFSTNLVLHRVSAAGGESTPVTELDKALGETYHATPWFLPDGRHFLYTAWSAKPENRGVYIGSLDSKTRTRLMTAESKALYVPPGYILFMRDRVLMARAFDAKRLQFTADAVPVAEDPWYDAASGAAAFYASDDGTLIYRRGAATPSAATRQWLWADRSGKTGSPVGPQHDAVHLKLSPDGKRIAFYEAPATTPEDVWLYDIERDLRTRLTTDPARDGFPVWSPDGLRIVFASDRSSTAATAGRAAGWALYEKPSSGAVPEQLLLPSEQGKALLPFDWSADGKAIVSQKFDATIGPNSGDLWVVPLAGDRKPYPYLATMFSEGEPALSPDGRWLAYVTNESGGYEVVVQPFPDPTGGKWQISTKGGHFPRWKRDGRELYYVDSDRQMVAVSVNATRNFELGKSTRLFVTALDFPLGAATEIPYDVSPDGQRFMLSVSLIAAPTATSTPITVVTNWPSALKR